MASDSAADIDQEFQEWKVKFGKTYSSPEEEARRKTIWVATRTRVLAHNTRAEQGLETYTQAVNHFADMKPEEVCCCGGKSRRQCGTDTDGETQHDH
ncbi:hypothetical protein ACEWY4_005871 [Coilia grayii]|uniref:Cystein proteinase inhibitor protein salarin n=1 Tax=Coilia grayii TaxID=363190 RepID=A0ABD1KK68_9TELE